jgi:hypothetical protein
MAAMTSPKTRSFALSVAATAAAVVLAGCGDDPSDAAEDSGTARDSSSPSTPTQEPSTTDPAPSRSGDSGAPTDLTTVPVYFVGDGPSGPGGSRGPLLFREFRQVPADNPLAEAAALLTAGDALDPDYRTLFPGGDVIEGVAYDDVTGAVTVLVKDDRWAELPSGMSKAEGRLAVQSLVYTLQGVSQARVPVRVLRGEGGPAVPLFGIETRNGVEAAPPIDVLNLVNVTAPEEGATVSGSFTASGVGSSFEATIPWEIRQGDQVVEQGFTTAEGWGEKLYPWEAEVDVSKLAPGEYTFAALTDDATGGTEGFGAYEDTKTVIVE